MQHKGSVGAAVSVVLVVLAAALLAGACGGSTTAGKGSPTASAAPSTSSSSVTTSSPTASASPAGELVFADEEFAFELRRTMSAIYVGEADLGECLATAGRITDGDFESWYRQWYATAEHFHGVAEKALAAGHRVSARQAYYRAATYYRTAEFFLHGDPDDPRIVATWKKGRDAFVTAAGMDAASFEPVEIPYGKTTLPGYFYKAAGAKGRRPLLIVQTGFDGCQEELHAYALAGLERGYNVLTFEGPGQGRVIRVQHLAFCADWERVVRRVVDYAIGRADVDADRIALWGISLGGYLAPRAAAYDHRIAAVISDGAVYDVGTSLLGGLQKSGVVPASMTEKDLQEYLSTNPKEFNQAIRTVMSTDTRTRWQNEQGMYVFRVGSPALFWAAYMDFTLKGSASRIRCPALVCYGTADAFDPGGRQAKRLYEDLTSAKKLMRFTQQYEAGYHCQLGAFALSFADKFDWLDDTLSVTGG